MKKLLNKIFPIFDYVYIYQILEYNSVDYIKWFLKNPFKRNLQKKHTLILSKKTLAILAGTIIEEIIIAIIFTFFYQDFFFVLVFIFVLIQFLTPFFIITANLFYAPVEIYLKNKILKQAKEKLNKLPNLKIVGITGSFGKTSTKDILYTLLWKKYYVVKTPKSFNTPLGIAQTILEEIKQNTQIFIAEMGAYKIGEIAKIAKLIRPSIGIITAVAPQHLEKFGSIENIAKAKFELIESLPKNGLAILNSEYPLLQNQGVTWQGSKVVFYNDNESTRDLTVGVSSLDRTSSATGKPTTLQSGFYRDKGYYATNIKTDLSGTDFLLNTPKSKAQIHLPLIGEHHIQNFLAASIAALTLGLTLKEIKERASFLLPTPHRLEISKQGNITIIDNSFNTNPKSAEASLQLLKKYAADKRIVITPGLIELGSESSKENINFAKKAAKIADQFIIVGEKNKEDLLKGLGSANFAEEKIHLLKSTSEALKFASNIAEPNTVALLENDLPDQYS